MFGRRAIADGARRGGRRRDSDDGQLHHFLLLHNFDDIDNEHDYEPDDYNDDSLAGA